MKTFSFSLERVRLWRARQVSLEEARLEKILAERHLLEQRRELLEREASESATALANAGTVTGEELQAAAAYRRYVAAQRVAISALQSQLDQRVAEQRNNVIEAHRKSELLDKLLERRLETWNKDFSRELEANAGEAFLAKWRDNRAQPNRTARPDAGSLPPPER